MKLQEEMCSIFLRGGFLLHKWSSSDPSVLESIFIYLRDPQATVILSDSEQYIKTLGMEWNTSSDHFHVSITELQRKLTQASFISEWRTVMGWFMSPLSCLKPVLLPSNELQSQG